MSFIPRHELLYYSMMFSTQGTTSGITPNDVDLIIWAETKDFHHIFDAKEPISAMSRRRYNQDLSFCSCG